ncbi:type II secretion system protein GspM [Xanthomonas maliensis]|uniref:type II secretion system protein GspM n=1 Tax=Xanthomonas maliensis TaxID=1321368 RepID=UPI0003B601F2|nr:type II secretion system protein GspM [Xanthomonas maliensis]KAB7767855.1 type II secretion system protein M [Xanthomonas maliensis]
MKEWLHRVQAAGRGRSARERVLLAVMTMSLLAFVGWYALVAPLRQWQRTAQARYDTAAQELLMARGAQRQANPAMLTRDALLQSARVAGIVVSRQHAGAVGVLDLQIDAVPGNVLFAWFAQLRRSHGIAPVTLQLTRGDGQLQVRCRFEGLAP